MYCNTVKFVVFFLKVIISSTYSAIYWVYIRNKTYVKSLNRPNISFLAFILVVTLNIRNILQYRNTLFHSLKDIASPHWESHYHSWWWMLECVNSTVLEPRNKGEVLFWSWGCSSRELSFFIHNIWPSFVLELSTL